MSDLSDGWVASDGDESGDSSSKENDDTNLLFDEAEETDVDVSPVNIKIEKDSDAESPLVSPARTEKSRRQRSPTSDKFDDYLRANPKLVNVPSSTTADWKITDDDEIWLMRCPSSFAAASLKGVPVLQTDKRRIKIPHSGHECVAYERSGARKVALLTPSSSHHGIAFKDLAGTLVVRERIESANGVEVDERPPAKTVPFPANLKMRHPLFGADYKRQIKLPGAVSERLREMPRVKSSKTKRKREEPDPDDDRDAPMKKKPAKKRKHHDEDDERANIKEETAWETEMSIEQSLFDTPVKKKRKIKQ